MQLGFIAGIVLQIIHEKTSSNSSKKDTKLMSERQIAELFYLALYFLDIFTFVLGALQPMYLALQTLCRTQFSRRQHLMKK